MQTELGKLPLRAAESAFGERKKKRGETGKKNLRNENEQMQTRSKCKARESLGSRVVYSMPLRTRCASWRDQFAPERSSSWRVQVVARFCSHAPRPFSFTTSREPISLFPASGRSSLFAWPRRPAPSANGRISLGARSPLANLETRPPPGILFLHVLCP